MKVRALPTWRKPVGEGAKRTRGRAESDMGFSGVWMILNGKGGNPVPRETNWKSTVGQIAVGFSEIAGSEGRLPSRQPARGRRYGSAGGRRYGCGWGRGDVTYGGIYGVGLYLNLIDVGHSGMKR